MKKSESLALFNERYVRDRVKEKVLEAEDFILRYKEELAAEFVDSFRKYCRKVKAMQLSGEIGNVRYINYAMLRTSILADKPQYRIDVYNKDWYYDSGQKECPGEYDGSRVFDFLEQIQRELEALRRENYFHQVSIVDIERVKIQEAHIFNQLMTNLARYALYQQDLGRDFAEIAKEDKIEVRMGEYYDVSAVIYKEDKRKKDSAEIKDWLEDKLENKYVAEVLKSLDLSAGDYKHADLRFVDFSGSNLAKSNMKGAWLIKARLRECLMENANLAKAVIHDANFNGADLRHAVFDAVLGNRGMAETMNTRIYSLWGVDFSGANLEQASFRKAKLQGADFRGAHLAGTDFSGADLTNAIFQRAALNVLDLTEEQAQAVNWVD